MLDEKDLKIIEHLMRCSRTPTSEIARFLGLSDVAVIKRIRKLEQRGVIKKYTVVVDPKKLGYNFVSLTGLDVEPDKLLEVINLLKERNYVRYLAITSGDHTIMAIIWAKDNEEFMKIINELKKFPGVKRVCPAVVLDVVKE